MDMKKILQTLDRVADRPVQGANDMKKFLSIVRQPLLNESVITSFEEDTVGGDANAYLMAADNIRDMVMGNIDKIKINADERMLKDVMLKFNQFMTAYHAMGKEILQPDMFVDSLGEGSVKDQMHDDAERMSRAEFVKKHGEENGEFWDNIMGESVSEAASAAQQAAIAIAKKKTQSAKEGIANGLVFKDYFALEEAKHSVTRKK